MADREDYEKLTRLRANAEALRRRRRAKNRDTTPDGVSPFAGKSASAPMRGAPNPKYQYQDEPSLNNARRKKA